MGSLLQSVSTGEPLLMTDCCHTSLSHFTRNDDIGFTYCFLYVGLVQLGKPTEAETQVKRREVYKTVVTTQYETIQAMTNLAVVNCQIYGRNALNLKV